jgi:hypothetical protein
VGTEPPPPVVTIINPAASGPLSDVIGPEASRPPRQLTPTQRRLAWLAVVIVTTTALGGWGASRIRATDRLDREALREVQVGLVGGDTSSLAGGAGRVDLALLSNGPHPVTVVSVRLDVPGFPTLPADPNRLRPHEPELVTFPSPSVCPASLSRAFDAMILLRVRTYRGDETTLRLATSPAAGAYSAGFVFESMERCGLYPPGLSLEAQRPTGTSRRGRDLDLTLPLRNRSAAERTITSLQLSGGLALRDQAPRIVLAGGMTVELPLRLHLTDCETALGSWGLALQQQGFTPTFRGAPGGGSLDATVVGDGRTERAANLLSAGDEVVGQWVLDTCLG